MDSRIVASMGFALLLATACSGSDASQDDPGRSTSAGSGGGSAGSSGAGAHTGSGGTSSNCPPGPDPSMYAELFGDPCCSKEGGTSHCVPSSFVPAEVASHFDACTTKGQDGGYCVPDEIISAGEGFQPKACVFQIGNGPGVCLSLCIPEIASNPNVSLLQQLDCAAGDVCVPCTNPLDMTSTGACDLKGKDCGDTSSSSASSGSGGGDVMCPYDGPPLVDPSMFPPCAPACDGAHCVPAAVVPADEQAQLAPCTDGFCVPDEFIASANKSVPDTCTSAAGAEGRCLSTCLPDVAAKADLLPQDVCAAGQKCAPCYDPTAPDPSTPTGACGLACDAPTKPPTVLTCPWNGPAVLDPSALPSCGCGDLHCLDAALVPAAQQAELTACQGKNGAAGFCTPAAIIAAGGNYVPPTCDPFPGSGAEGRCLSTCLPSVAAKLGDLSQSSCSGGEACVPCTDPFSGQPTGACSTSCDSPKQAPYTFPFCGQFCGGYGGTCIPEANLVAQGQDTSKLFQQDCPNGPGNLCVPIEYVPYWQGQGYLPFQCTAGLVIPQPGACVNDCLVDTGAFGFLLSQSDCPDGYKCASCLLADAPGCN